MNGMMTQNVRIKFGDNIEEAHMRNRALIANWCYEHSDGVIEVVERDGKHYIKINDYPALRQLFARLLAEIQRIKSEGDYEAAQHLVETYAVKINPDLHKEVLSRYEKLNIAPYKGFLNPKMTPVYGSDGEITDVLLDFSESYTEQMLRYSRDYSVEDWII
jgi:dipeptidyl-peptidase-3